MKTVQIALIACIVGLMSSCNEQLDSNNSINEYHRLTEIAMLHYALGCNAQSEAYFERAFQIRKRVNETDYLYAAAAAFKNNNLKKAKEYLENSIVYTNANINYLNSFKEFDQFRESETFKGVISDYEYYKELYGSKLEHPEFNQKLEELISRDQANRKGLYPKDSFKIIDSLNVIDLKSLTDQYGWNEKGWLILWHQRDSFKDDNWIWNYFRPVLNKNIADGKARRSFWAQFEDHEAIVTNGTQIYGSYISQTDTYPIVDIENVDKRRRDIGLPPLWYMNKVYGYDLPAGYTYNTGKRFNEEAICE